jgi:hypothetical protein
MTNENLTESVSENQKKNRSPIMMEYREAIIKGLAHPKSHVNQHGTVRFTEDFVTLSVVLTMYSEALQGSSLDSSKQANMAALLSELEDIPGLEDVPHIEITAEFPQQNFAEHLEAIKQAIIAGLPHPESYVYRSHGIRTTKNYTTIPALLYLYRGALNGTTLERPEYLPNHWFPERTTRTPEDDHDRMYDDLMHERFH